MYKGKHLCKKKGAKIQFILMTIFMCLLIASAYAMSIESSNEPPEESFETQEINAESLPFITDEQEGISVTLPAISESIETVDIAEYSQTDIVYEEATEEPIYYEKYTSDSIIRCSSNLSGEQINELLSGTDLYGCGEYIYNIEQEYGINAFFTMSVASLESGYGTSWLAKNKNNIFGMLGCSFKSIESCINYFGKLMYEYEFNHNVTMTPNGISKRYCPEGPWSRDVTIIMNTYVNKANDLY